MCQNPPYELTTAAATTTQISYRVYIYGWQRKSCPIYFLPTKDSVTDASMTMNVIKSPNQHFSATSISQPNHIYVA